MVNKILIDNPEIGNELVSSPGMIDVLKNIKIPLPPLPVQKQIAAVLEKSIAVEPLEKKLHQAVKQRVVAGKNFKEKVANGVVKKVITQDEAKQLCDAFAARMCIINVDDFAPEELVSRFSQQDEAKG